MKSYDTLIKISKAQLDERRKALAVLLDKKEDFLNRIKKLDEELRSEVKKINAIGNSEDFTMRNQFMVYASSVVTRQTEYSNQAEMLNPEINRISDEVRNHFANMKKYEIFRDKKIEEIENLMNKKIQSDLDEIAINNFIRKNKKSYEQS